MLALVGALLLTAPGFVAARGLSGAELEAQKGISAAFVRNVLARDWDAVAGMYAEDAILCPRTAEPPEDGYALVRQALAARGSDPEMEYGAALMTCDRSRPGLSDEHLRRAVAGAREGSDLARTIDAHRALWGGGVQTLRAATR